MVDRKAMYKIHLAEYFEASHQLKNHYGRCQNLHGHNYLVEAIVTSEELTDTNIVVDSGYFKQYLDENLDHSHLNDTMNNDNPSAEYIAKYIFNGFDEFIKELKNNNKINNNPIILEITVHENYKTKATYGIL